MSWHKHFFYRKESWKTTWKLKLSLLIFIALVTFLLTRNVVTESFANGLVCAQSARPSDALLLENFDPNYLVFERARSLRAGGVARKVFVPLLGERTDSESVAEGFINVMARISRIGEFEIVPVPEVEPISLNAAKEIRSYLLNRQIKSVIVVAPAFRSRRSEMIYSAVLTPAGISVGCVPVFGTTNPTNWTDTWHGIQEAMEQFSKLQYYRFYVLRNTDARDRGTSAEY